MEINLKKLSEQQATSTANERKMKLSEDAQSMVFQLFTKNVYSNPIGTIVREITSNCDDSHVEAGVDSPILIKKFTDPQTETQYISFIDFGVGMSPDRVYDIYGTYFESTKRVDNTQIGGFGIGGKTPLAYKRSTGQGEGEYDNSFYVITNYNGTKYYYCIYEGADTPVISELHKEKTTDRNGTEVRVPVLQKDVETFAKEMVRQLYYFDNVVFEGFEDTYQDSTLSNEYTIVRGKTFMYRGTNYANNMHVALGKVAYPLDYNALGLDSYEYRLPIAIKLNVGDVNVTVSRESLDYSESTIKKIKKALEEAKAEIIELLSKQYSDIQTLEQYFEVKTNFGTLNFSNGMSLHVGELVKQKDVDFSNFNYSFMKMPNDKQLFSLFFDVKSYGKKPSRSRWDDPYRFNGGYEALTRNNNLYYVEDEFNRKVVKQAYLKFSHDLYHIITKSDLMNDYLRKSICEMFNVDLESLTTEKGNPVKFMKTLVEMQDEYFEIVRRKASDYDKLVVPEDFIEERKRERLSARQLQTTIPVNFIGGQTRQRVKISELVNYKQPIFYGTQENESELNQAYRMFEILFPEVRVIRSTDWNGLLRYEKGKGNIMFLRLAQNNVKYMEHCKTAYPVSQIETRMFRRKEANVRKYFYASELVSNFNSIEGFYGGSAVLSLISPVWGAKVKEVEDYIEALPEEARSDSFKYNKTLLEKYFKLDDLKYSAEHKKMQKRIDEVKALAQKNEGILKFIDLPYYGEKDVERYDKELIKILKKVMVF